MALSSGGLNRNEQGDCSPAPKYERLRGSLARVEFKLTVFRQVITQCLQTKKMPTPEKVGKSLESLSERVGFEPTMQFLTA